MSDYTYPSSDLDRAERLLELLGSFWDDVYGGKDVVRSLLGATAATYQQLYLDLLELVNSISRNKVPVFHRENWTLLRLLESETNRAELATPQLEQSYFNDSTLVFDAVGSGPLYAWQLPDNMVSAPVIMNRITASSVTLTSGVDYLVRDGFVGFVKNPFDNALIPKRAVLENGVVVDREVALWVFKGEFDYQTVYRQFGYALGIHLQSSEHYKMLINAVMDAMTGGTTMQQIRDAWTAITGVPLARSDNETVIQIQTEDDRQTVVTDKNVYQFNLSTDLSVGVDDKLVRGQALCNALQFYEFNRGQVPTVEELSALAVGPGLLATGYYNSLIFENIDTPLIVETDENGYTKISWRLGGWPGDVAKFFDDLHTNGIARGQTMANLIDQRPAANRDTEPTAGALPSVINPLAFLCSHVLRNNAFVVVVRPQGFRDGLGLNAAKLLRKIVPPQTAMIVVVQLEHADEPIIMEEAGDTDKPGYEERVVTYNGMFIGETLTAGAVTERVHLRQIGGRCI